MLVGSFRPMITVSLTKFGAWLKTFTATGIDVVRFPEVSRATAVSAWLPFGPDVVSHVTLKGGEVSSVPRLLPSSLNCTPATPRLSFADAATVTAPDTVPGAGVVI